MTTSGGSACAGTCTDTRRKWLRPDSTRAWRGRRQSRRQSTSQFSKVRTNAAGSPNTTSGAPASISARVTGLMVTVKTNQALHGRAKAIRVR